MSAWTNVLGYVKFAVSHTDVSIEEGLRDLLGETFNPNWETISGQPLSP